ncbi:Nucleoid occlusion protein [Anaerolineae bacterium]|nr:Nucleoid occlusion protein [Anaerolineae bacterium]
MSTRTVTLDEAEPTALDVRRTSRNRRALDPDAPREGQVSELLIATIRAGDNDRTVFNDAKLDELAESIRSAGLAQPITVRPITLSEVEGRTFLYEIVAGERRFRACTKLGWVKIPAIVRTLSDEQAAEIMLAENVHRADLNPMDEAHAYRKRMDKFGWTVSQVAQKSNKSDKHINARLLLLNLISEAQAMVQRDLIGVAFGEEMALLDQNRQRIALKYLANTERPLLREFRAICGELQAEQAQERFLDPDDFIRATANQNSAQRAAILSERNFPIDENLPHMERRGSIGASFEAYIADLLASDDPYHRECAPVVGRIYDSLLRGGMAYAAGKSPKRKSA